MGKRLETFISAARNKYSGKKKVIGSIIPPATRLYKTSRVIPLRSAYMAIIKQLTSSEVPGSIPGATTFSE
jgi:hypothetical protein